MNPEELRELRKLSVDVVRDGHSIAGHAMCDAADEIERLTGLLRGNNPRPPTTEQFREVCDLLGTPGMLVSTYGHAYRLAVDEIKRLQKKVQEVLESRFQTVEENDSLRKDAERYRWLRDHRGWPFENTGGANLDAAIDAALEGK